MKRIEDTVVDIIKKELDNVEVTNGIIHKLNGVTRIGIFIKEPNDACAEVYYIDEMMEECIPSVEIAEQIILQYKYSKKHKTRDSDILNFINDYDRVKDCLSLILVNVKYNSELLHDHPYEPFLDLAAIVIINLPTEDDSNGIIKVSNKIIDMWNKSFEEVFDQAYWNFNHSAYVIDSMTHTLFNLGIFDSMDVGEPIYDADNYIYILTNRSKYYGAVELLRPDSMKNLANKYESDLMIIPSSVHECILIPVEYCGDAQEVSEMIKEVNNSVVHKTDWLADHPYKYIRDTGTVICLD